MAKKSSVKADLARRLERWFATSKKNLLDASETDRQKDAVKQAYDKAAARFAMLLKEL